MIIEILQFPVNFQNQKIKWKGNSQIMNYEVIKEYTPNRVLRNQEKKYI